MLKLKNYLKNLPQDRQEKIEKRSQDLIAEEKSLQELRKALHHSQEELARKLHVNQAAISKIEKRTDMFVSTLRSFIEGMGGDLEIIAHFPKKPPIRISQFHDIETSSTVKR